MLEVEPSEVAEKATKPSPAPLQKHSLGEATCQAGAIWQYTLVS